MKDKILTLDWDVTKEKLFLEDGSEVKSHRAIVRDDNEKVISVMKKSYNPLRNEEFIERIEKIKEISGFELEGYSTFRDGVKVIANLKNNGDTIRIGGHRLDNYMTIGNGHDGSSSFFIGASTEYIWCQNQFGQISKMAKIRHTKNAGEKLEELYVYLDYFFNKRDKMVETFNRFGDVRISEEMTENMVNFVLGIDEKEEVSERRLKRVNKLRASIVTDVNGLGDNLWGLFNGVTRFTTHEMNSKNDVLGNIFGSKAIINNKAFALAEKMLESATL